MIEACISLRHNGETLLKKRGDILCVKLPGSPWGSMEKKFHTIIEMEDAVLEAALIAMRNNGETHPVISNPYSVYEDVQTDLPEGKKFVQRNLTVRSSKYLDVDALPDKEKADVLDSTKTKEKITLDKVEIKERVK